MVGCSSRKTGKRCINIVFRLVFNHYFNHISVSKSDTWKRGKSLFSNLLTKQTDNYMYIWKPQITMKQDIRFLRKILSEISYPFLLRSSMIQMVLDYADFWILTASTTFSSWKWLYIAVCYHHFNDKLLTRTFDKDIMTPIPTASEYRNRNTLYWFTFNLCVFNAVSYQFTSDWILSSKDNIKTKVTANQTQPFLCS